MNRKLIIPLAIMIAVSVCITVAAHNKAPGTLVYFSDSNILKPAFVPHKQNVIKLYPNPTTNGTIKVSAVNKVELFFYVFDIEGSLISQKILKDKRLHTITNLKKGVYLYDVFNNDESIEQGKIIVK